MANDSVAVIISVYSSEVADRLDSCLKSLKEQTYNNIHVYLAKEGPLTTELDKVINDYISNLLYCNKTKQYTKS